MPLTGRLFALIALTLFPAIAIEAYNEYAFWRSRQADARQEAQRQAQQASADLDRMLDGIRYLLTAVAEVPSVRALQTSDCAPYLERMRRQFPHLASLVAVGRDGRLRCYQPEPSPDLRLDDQPHIRDALAGWPFAIGGYTDGRISGHPVLPLAVPMRDETGGVVGAIVAGLDVNWLTGRLEQRLLPPGGSLTVSDRNGVIVARTPLPERFIGTRIPDAFLGLINGAAPGVFDARSQDGEYRIYGYVPTTLPPYGLYVSTGISSATAFAEVNRAAERAFALLAAGLLLAMLAAWYAGRYFIRRPLALLLAAVEAGSRGDYAARATVPDGASEFASLSRAYNAMVELVAEREAERDRGLAELRLRDERLGELNRTLEQRVEAAVAARSQVEDALRQAQKMEAVGQLTGGVAHDFNNLLTGIVGNLELLERRVPPEARRYLDSAMRAAERGARLTGQLLAFARRQQLDIHVIEPNAVIAAVDDLLRRTLGGLIRIDLKLEPGLWPALADPTQVELILLNLAINARDAMPEGGVLTIETANRTLPQSAPLLSALPAGPTHGPPPGDYVALIVRDTGTGMPPQVLARAFEPFFTTKEIGRGSGLGLPQVLGVATQLGGGVAIDSAPGKGTTVTVYLARASQPAAAAPGLPAAPPPSLDVAGLTILLVDDDPDVRGATEAMLQELGCVVAAVDSGVAALSLLEQQPAMDLALIDFAMPGLSGADTAAWIAERWPGLPVLMMTGYADDSMAGGVAGLDPRRRSLLKKPFRSAELAVAIRVARTGRTAAAQRPTARPGAATDRI